MRDLIINNVPLAITVFGCGAAVSWFLQRQV